MELESGEIVSVTVISNKKQQLQENQILMKVNRSKNRQGLVRNIVYFLNWNNQVKTVKQYYVNKKVCGNIESIEFSVSSHGNSKDKKPFYVIKKSTISSNKSQLSGSSSKRSISALYDKIPQYIGDDCDFGDRPRSKKQLIDLCRTQYADNEVGDFLAYNEKLRDGSTI